MQRSDSRQQDERPNAEEYVGPALHDAQLGLPHSRSLQRHRLLRRSDGYLLTVHGFQTDFDGSLTSLKSSHFFSRVITRLSKDTLKVKFCGGHLFIL